MPPELNHPAELILQLLSNLSHFRKPIQGYAWDVVDEAWDDLEVFEYIDVQDKTPIKTTEADRDVPQKPVWRARLTAEGKTLLRALQTAKPGTS